MMSTDHFTAFQTFLAQKAQERKLTEAGQIIALIPEFWDTLIDEALTVAAVDAMELAQINQTIPRQEESLVKLRERKAELEGKSGPSRVTSV